MSYALVPEAEAKVNKKASKASVAVATSKPQKQKQQKRARLDVASSDQEGGSKIVTNIIGRQAPDAKDTKTKMLTYTVELADKTTKSLFVRDLVNNYFVSSKSGFNSVAEMVEKYDFENIQEEINLLEKKGVTDSNQAVSTATFKYYGPYKWDVVNPKESTHKALKKCVILNFEWYADTVLYSTGEGDPRHWPMPIRDIEEMQKELPEVCALYEKLSESIQNDSSVKLLTVVNDAKFEEYEPNPLKEGYVFHVESDPFEMETDRQWLLRWWMREVRRQYAKENAPPETTVIATQNVDEDKNHRGGMIPDVSNVVCPFFWEQLPCLDDAGTCAPGELYRIENYRCQQVVCAAVSQRRGNTTRHFWIVCEGVNENEIGDALFSCLCTSVHPLNFLSPKKKNDKVLKDLPYESDLIRHFAGDANVPVMEKLLATAYLFYCGGFPVISRVCAVASPLQVIVTMGALNHAECILPVEQTYFAITKDLKPTVLFHLVDQLLIEQLIIALQPYVEADASKVETETIAKVYVSALTLMKKATRERPHFFTQENLLKWSGFEVPEKIAAVASATTTKKAKTINLLAMPRAYPAMTEPLKFESVFGGRKWTVLDKLPKIFPRVEGLARLDSSSKQDAYVAIFREDEDGEVMVAPLNYVFRKITGLWSATALGQLNYCDIGGKRIPYFPMTDGDFGGSYVNVKRWGSHFEGDHRRHFPGFFPPAASTDLPSATMTVEERKAANMADEKQFNFEFYDKTTHPRCSAEMCLVHRWLQFTNDDADGTIRKQLTRKIFWCSGGPGMYHEQTIMTNTNYPDYDKVYDQLLQPAFERAGYEDTVYFPATMMTGYNKDHTVTLIGVGIYFADEKDFTEFDVTAFALKTLVPLYESQKCATEWCWPHLIRTVWRKPSAPELTAQKLAETGFILSEDAIGYTKAYVLTNHRYQEVSPKRYNQEGGAAGGWHHSTSQRIVNCEMKDPETDELWSPFPGMPTLTSTQKIQVRIACQSRGVQGIPQIWMHAVCALQRREGASVGETPLCFCCGDPMYVGWLNEKGQFDKSVYEMSLTGSSDDEDDDEDIEARLVEGLPPYDNRQLVGRLDFKETNAIGNYMARQCRLPAQYNPKQSHGSNKMFEKLSMQTQHPLNKERPSEVRLRGLTEKKRK